MEYLTEKANRHFYNWGEFENSHDLFSSSWVCTDPETALRVHLSYNLLAPALLLHLQQMIRDFAIPLNLEI